MYAVIKTGGKQFRAEPGTRLRIPSLDVEPGESVTFDHVLLVGNEGDVKIGKPTVPGATVTRPVMLVR